MTQVTCNLSKYSTIWQNLKARSLGKTKGHDGNIKPAIIEATLAAVINSHRSILSIGANSHQMILVPLLVYCMKLFSQYI